MLSFEWREPTIVVSETSITDILLKIGCITWMRNQVGCCPAYIRSDSGPEFVSKAVKK